MERTCTIACASVPGFLGRGKAVVFPRKAIDELKVVVSSDIDEYKTPASRKKLERKQELSSIMNDVCLSALSGKREMRAVILGTGFAGLRTAQVLERCGLFEAVTVFEARSQPGGRVRTQRGRGDEILEEGAQWIHGTEGNPLVNLFEEDEEERVSDVNALKTVLAWSDDGSPVDKEVYRAAWRYTSRAIEQCENGQGEYRSIGERVRAEVRSEAKRQYSDNTESVQQFIACSEHRLLYEESMSAGAVADLDLRSWGEYRERDGPNIRVQKGYDRLIQRIANSLTMKTSLRYGVTVRRLKRDAQNNIQVFLSDESMVTADAAVVTVSLGALKRGDIIFEPPLPSAQALAIDRIGFGTVNKLAISFSKAWWLESECGTWECVQRIPADSWLGHTVAWRPVPEPGPKNTLMAWVTEGNDFESFSDTQILETALNHLATVSGKPRSFLNACAPKISLRTRWQTDLAGGSYSFVKVGASGKDFDALASMDNWPILFAGEHTHRTRYSTADGAYLSGERAAARIIRQTQPPPFACVIVRKGNLLLAEHRASSNRIAPGRLTCFGGKREPGESALDCASREFLEETGHSLDSNDLDFSCLLLVNGIQIAHFFILENENHSILHDNSISNSSSSGALWAAPSDKRWSSWHSAVLEAVLDHNHEVAHVEDGDRVATLDLISSLPTAEDYAPLFSSESRPPPSSSS